MRPSAQRGESNASIATMRSTRSAQGRISMEDFYYSHPLNQRTLTKPPPIPENPPSYELSTTSKDEGQEVLPAYTCTILQQAVFSRKLEFESAVQKATNRNWHKVWLVLQGTALHLYQAKNVSFFSAQKCAPNTSPDLPPYIKQGELLQTYSLQYAEVGIAADYEKRRFVMRLRVEGDQFLLSCLEIETFLVWIDALAAAIGLAPSLDDRKLPVDAALPRNTQRQRTPGRAGMVEFRINEALPERNAPARTDVPIWLPARSSGEERDGSSSGTSTPGRQSGASSATSSRRQSRASSRRSSRADLASPVVEIASSSSSLADASSSSSLSTPSSPLLQAEPAHPSISPETGKWRPRHQSSPMYDMLFAKRCSAVLLEKSPRKTNLVIMKGKQWAVDWSTGLLQRLEPPDYAEVERFGPWGVGNGVRPVRI